MALFNPLRLFGARRVARPRRRARVEQLESRELLAADTGVVDDVLLGGVYFEEATGDDSEADILQVSFEGGAEGTTLDRLVIDGDKLSDGISSGDLFFDIEAGGLGAFEAVGLTVLSTEGFSVTGVEVIDGGTSIAFTFDGFDAGETFVFSVDVDEAQFVDSTTGDVDSNSLVEGSEFQRSTITAEFSAIGYEDLVLSGTYWDAFDDDRDQAEADTGLALTLPDDAYEANDDKSDRTAGAVVYAAQLPLASLSGYVYHDRSDDGLRDEATEEGIGGVQLELLDETGQGLGVFTTTDANGYYEFLNLTPGTYGVREVAQPDPYLDGKDTAGSHGGVAGNEIITGAVLDYGDNAIEYNFGELLSGSIAGRVGASHDGDCDFDDPDEPLAGVVIELLDANGVVITTTTTDADGYYKFDDLAPGEYQVREIQPSDYYDGGERAGTAGGDVSNDLVTGIVIGSDEHAVNYDFCEHIGATISGYVYHDHDDDGQFDPGEDPIDGVTLKLLDADGVDTGRRAVTDSNGFYQFSDLEAGKYTVMEVQPTGWYDGKDTPGTTGGDASVNDMIAMIMVDFGQTSEQNNFGELLGGSIAGRVGASHDGDCDFDDPDEPLAGVVIELLDANGVVITTATTDADGYYKFDDLAPGEYQVREIQPAGYYDGGERAGTAGGVVSNDLVTGIVIGSDVHAVNYDFCEHVGANLSGYVYHDQDDDGLFDPGEDPIAGVTITLFDEGGAEVASTTTDVNGFYVFAGLEAGKYTVIETQPIGWYDGKDTPGTTGGDASVNDRITQIMLDYGQSSEHNNFGELLGGSIAGRVGASHDGDCDFDDPDEPLAGVVIELLDANGVVITTTTTDADGYYKFDDLAPGEYQVREIQPSDYYDGGERAGTAGGDVSDDLVTGIVIGSDEHAVNYDFCEHIGATISGYVYHDHDDDGQFDPGEDPIDGVTLKLLDADGVDTGRRAVTDSNGFYQFSDLEAGKYTVMEVQPTGWYDGKDTPGTTGGDASVNDMIAMIMVDFGQTSEQNNFGELLGGSISGYVHVTTDPDCEPGPDDPGLAGVVIELLDEDGAVLATTTTNANGFYEFTDLPPGMYGVREVQPVDYFDAGDHVGTGGGSALANDLIVDIDVGSDEHWVDYNFCETPPAAISGYVFIDGAPIVSSETLTPELIAAEKDGLRTSDDTPVANVTLQLHDGITGEPIYADEALPGYYPAGPITTTTDANGYYEFLGLPPGVYAVVQIQPEDLIDSIDTQGSTGGYAVNPRIPGDGRIFPFDVQSTIDQFRSSFGDDALVRINLAVGQSSVENNFSEVRQTTIVIPPPTPPADPVPPTPPPVTPAAPVTSSLWALLAPAVDPSPEFGGGSRALGWTWHLSVVNAGQPRSTQVAEGEAEMRAVSMRLDAAEWNQIAMDRAEWSVIEDDEQVEELQQFVFGVEDAIPVSGDWDGDGADEIGVFVAGFWLLDLNGNGVWDKGDLLAQLGSESDLPVTGDWDGDGKTDIGIFGPAWPRDPHAIAREPGLPDAENYPTLVIDVDGVPRVKNMPPTVEDATSGARILRRTADGATRADLIDHVFHYGTAGDVPIAGDWNGDGIRTIGVYRDGQWQLDTNGDGRVSEADQSYAFGQAGDLPAVGDWNGDGIDDLGVFRGGEWLVDSNGDRQLDARDAVFELGEAGDTPIVGDWDGDGVDEPGAFSPAESAPEVRVSQKAG